MRTNSRFSLGVATLVIGLSMPMTVFAQQSQSTAGSPLAALSPAGGAPQGTPAEKRIAWARKVLASDPKRVDAWNELALALSRRARETSDTSFYKEAWTATEKSLQLEAGNLEARKLQVWILLGQHDFPRAVEAAEKINRTVPDDVLVYGFLSDGYVELGKYQEAEKAAQWMLDMRPGNVPGLTRAAHLRELFGDHEGAVELMDTAYQRTADGEVEDRAWILTQIAHLSLLTCRTDAAEKLLTDALALFPNYHYALAQMAEVKLQQGRPGDAVTFRERHYAAAPHPENQYELGVSLDRAGRTADARAAWQQFEAAARREMTSWDNANIELIYYYADHANRPAEALALARSEAARRTDVRTLEALAWALHKNGQSREGSLEMARALAVGVKDPVSFYRAGAIANGAGAAADAKRLLEDSLATCKSSKVADSARALVGTIGTGR